MAFKLYSGAQGNTPSYKIGREHAEYRSALRAAVSEILGSGPDRIHILHETKRGKHLKRKRVAVCEVQSRLVAGRGHKLSVRCTRVKPLKARRQR